MKKILTFICILLIALTYTFSLGISCQATVETDPLEWFANEAS